MWLMTKHGFYSVVCTRDDPKYKYPVDPDKVMIRSRWRQHLVTLKRRFPQLDGAILDTLEADYRWRVICDKKVWAECLKELVLEQDYGNFKEACANTLGECAYVDALHDTWITFFKAAGR